MRTGFDVLCARMMPGMARGAAANALTTARRVIFCMMFLSPIVIARGVAINTKPGSLGVSFTVMAGLVPAIDRGTPPLRIAGTKPGHDGEGWFIQGVGRKAGGIAMN